MTQPLEILLVEDNEGDVELVRAALQDEILSCNITVVNNGRQAWDLLVRHGSLQGEVVPQLIFLDLNLSGMDGKILLNLIKQDELLKRIPVVILTSSRAYSDIQETYAHHANCYVVKPFDGKEFKTTIRHAVDFWRNVAQLPHATAIL